MSLSDLQADLSSVQAAIAKAEAAQSYGTGDMNVVRAQLQTLYAERRRLRTEISAITGEDESVYGQVSYGRFVP